MEVKQEPKGQFIAPFWAYLIAIENAPPGTFLRVGIDDPTPYLPKTKPEAKELGLPEDFR